MYFKRNSSYQVGQDGRTQRIYGHPSIQNTNNKIVNNTISH